jgi:hypothetical protein
MLYMDEQALRNPRRGRLGHAHHLPKHVTIPHHLPETPLNPRREKCSSPLGQLEPTATFSRSIQPRTSLAAREEGEIHS